MPVVSRIVLRYAEVRPFESESQLAEPFSTEPTDLPVAFSLY
jgi:hypothetical protein